MTKINAIESFKSMYGDEFDFKRAVKKDRIAVRLDWSYYTDSLCKDGEIKTSQYNNWNNPF